MINQEEANNKEALKWFQLAQQRWRDYYIEDPDGVVVPPSDLSPEISAGRKADQENEDTFVLPGRAQATTKHHQYHNTVESSSSRPSSLQPPPQPHPATTSTRRGAANNDASSPAQALSDSEFDELFRDLEAPSSEQRNQGAGEGQEEDDDDSLLDLSLSSSLDDWLDTDDESDEKVVTAHEEKDDAPPITLRCALVAFYQKYNPERVELVDEQLAKYQNREDVMLRKLQRKYGEQSSASPELSVVASLINKYNNLHHRQQQQQQRSFQSRSSREVSSSSSSEPPQQRSTPSSPTKAATSTRDTSSSSQPTTNDESKLQDTAPNPARDRLIQFYTKYNPAKLSSVDKTLANYKGREAELFEKLEKKYVTGKNGVLPAAGDGPICYMEFECEGRNLGRVEIQLFTDKVPICAENFRALCTGEKGYGRSGKRLCFEQCPIHRLVPDFCVQGGDFTRGDGTGGESIYPPGMEFTNMWGKFKDEQFMMHCRKGLLSMANNGRNQNGSQFFFTMKSLPHLDGKHVVFGEVTKGFDVIETISKMPTIRATQRPKRPVMISSCGEVDVSSSSSSTGNEDGQWSMSVNVREDERQSTMTARMASSWGTTASRSITKPMPFSFVPVAAGSTSSPFTTTPEPSPFSVKPRSTTSVVLSRAGQSSDIKPFSFTPAPAATKESAELSNVNEKKETKEGFPISALSTFRTLSEGRLPPTSDDGSGGTGKLANSGGMKDISIVSNVIDQLRSSSGHKERAGTTPPWRRTTETICRTETAAGKQTNDKNKNPFANLQLVAPSSQAATRSSTIRSTLEVENPFRVLSTATSSQQQSQTTVTDSINDAEKASESKKVDQKISNKLQFVPETTTTKQSSMAAHPERSSRALSQKLQPSSVTTTATTSVPFASLRESNVVEVGASSSATASSSSLCKEKKANPFAKLQLVSSNTSTRSISRPLEGTTENPFRALSEGATAAPSPWRAAGVSSAATTQEKSDVHEPKNPFANLQLVYGQQAKSITKLRSNDTDENPFKALSQGATAAPRGTSQDRSISNAMMAKAGEKKSDTNHQGSPVQPVPGMAKVINPVSSSLEHSIGGVRAASTPPRATRATQVATGKFASSATTKKSTNEGDEKGTLGEGPSSTTSPIKNRSGTGNVASKVSMWEAKSSPERKTSMNPFANLKLVSRSMQSRPTSTVVDHDAPFRALSAAATAPKESSDSNETEKSDGSGTFMKPSFILESDDHQVSDATSSVCTGESDFKVLWKRSSETPPSHPSVEHDSSHRTSISETSPRLELDNAEPTKVTTPRGTLRASASPPRLREVCITGKPTPISSSLAIEEEESYARDLSVSLKGHSGQSSESGSEELVETESLPKTPLSEKSHFSRALQCNNMEEDEEVMISDQFISLVEACHSVEEEEEKHDLPPSDKGEDTVLRFSKGAGNVECMDMISIDEKEIDFLVHIPEVANRKVIADCSFSVSTAIPQHRQKQRTFEKDTSMPLFALEPSPTKERYHMDLDEQALLLGLNGVGTLLPGSSKENSGAESEQEELIAFYRQENLTRIDRIDEMIKTSPSRPNIVEKRWKRDTRTDSPNRNMLPPGLEIKRTDRAGDSFPEPEFEQGLQSFDDAEISSNVWPEWMCMDEVSVALGSYSSSRFLSLHVEGSQERSRRWFQKQERDINETVMKASETSRFCLDLDQHRETSFTLALDENLLLLESVMTQERPSLPSEVSLDIESNLDSVDNEVKSDEPSDDLEVSMPRKAVNVSALHELSDIMAVDENVLGMLKYFNSMASVVSASSRKEHRPEILCGINTIFRRYCDKSPEPSLQRIRSVLHLEDNLTAASAMHLDEQNLLISMAYREYISSSSSSSSSKICEDEGSNVKCLMQSDCDSDYNTSKETTMRKGVSFLALDENSLPLVAYVHHEMNDFDEIYATVDLESIQVFRSTRIEFAGSREGREIFGSQLNARPSQLSLNLDENAVGLGLLSLPTSPSPAEDSSVFIDALQTRVSEVEDHGLEKSAIGTEMGMQEGLDKVDNINANARHTREEKSKGFITPDASTDRTQSTTRMESEPRIDKVDLRHKLVAFYEQHNPGRIEQIDQQMKKFEGNEIEMVARIKKKYGVMIELNHIEESTTGTRRERSTDLAAEREGCNDSELDGVEHEERKRTQNTSSYSLSEDQMPSNSNASSQLMGPSDNSAHVDHRLRLKVAEAVDDADECASVQGQPEGSLSRSILDQESVESTLGRDPEALSPSSPSCEIESRRPICAEEHGGDLPTTQDEIGEEETFSEVADQFLLERLELDSIDSRVKDQSSSLKSRIDNLLAKCKNEDQEEDEDTTSLLKWTDLTEIEMTRRRILGSGIRKGGLSLDGRHKEACLLAVDKKCNDGTAASEWNKLEQQESQSKHTSDLDIPDCCPLSSSSLSNDVLNLSPSGLSTTEDVQVVIENDGTTVSSTSVSVPSRLSAIPTPTKRSWKKTKKEALTYRQRLVRIYEKYNPAKLEKIDYLLQKYKGKEDDLLALVEDKYCRTIPMPGEGKVHPLSSSSSSVSSRDKLVALFRRFNPSKLSNVDKLMEKYEGKEDSLVMKVKAKYEGDKSVSLGSTSLASDDASDALTTDSFLVDVIDIDASSCSLLSLGTARSSEEISQEVVQEERDHPIGVKSIAITPRRSRSNPASPANSVGSRSRVKGGDKESPKTTPRRAKTGLPSPMKSLISPPRSDRRVTSSKVSLETPVKGLFGTTIFAGDGDAGIASPNCSVHSGLETIDEFEASRNLFGTSDFLSEEDTLRSRLVAFYLAHNPERMVKVDKQIKDFENDVPLMLKKMKKKYGSAVSLAGLKGYEHFLHEETKASRFSDTFYDGVDRYESVEATPDRKSTNVYQRIRDRTSFAVFEDLGKADKTEELADIKIEASFTDATDPSIMETLTECTPLIDNSTSRKSHPDTFVDEPNPQQKTPDRLLSMSQRELNVFEKELEDSLLSPISNSDHLQNERLTSVDEGIDESLMPRADLIDAMELFDELDLEGVQKLGIENFETLTSLIGLNLSKAGMEAHIRAVDPRMTGHFHRSTFSRWYFEYLREIEHWESRESRNDIGKTDRSLVGALQAFDTLDETKKGFLPRSSLGRLMQIVGEPLSGAEITFHELLIDPEETSVITKAGFVKWYLSILKASDPNRLRSTEDAPSSQDFRRLVDSFRQVSRNGTLSPTLMREILEHTDADPKTIRAMENENGKIRMEDFTRWYQDWLFNRPPLLTDERSRIGVVIETSDQNDLGLDEGVSDLCEDLCGTYEPSPSRVKAWSPSRKNYSPGRTSGSRSQVIQKVQVDLKDLSLDAEEVVFSPMSQESGVEVQINDKDLPLPPSVQRTKAAEDGHYSIELWYSREYEDIARHQVRHQSPENVKESNTKNRRILLEKELSTASGGITGYSLSPSRSPSPRSKSPLSDERLSYSPLALKDMSDN